MHVKSSIKSRSCYFMKDIIELSLNEARDSIESENVHSYKKRLS